MDLRPKLNAKQFFWPPPARFWWCYPLHNNLAKNIKPYLLSANDSGAHLSVSNAEFEGGGDGHSYGDRTFVPNKPNPAISRPVLVPAGIEGFVGLLKTPNRLYDMRLSFHRKVPFEFLSESPFRSYIKTSSSKTR
jgi:hypothetical protein